MVQTTQMSSAIRLNHRNQPVQPTTGQSAHIADFNFVQMRTIALELKFAEKQIGATNRGDFLGDKALRSYYHWRPLQVFRNALNGAADLAAMSDCF